VRLGVCVLFVVMVSAPLGCANGDKSRDVRFKSSRLMSLHGSYSELAGSTVAAARDVNGDGLGDFVVGAPQWYPGGAVYVVFGSRRLLSLSLPLSALGSHGFRIEGGHDFDTIGQNASGVGDFNGDGLADILVGGLGYARATYVVLGTRETSPVRVTSSRSRVIRIRNASPVGSAGDVNGDGFADVVVRRARQREPASLYVVFGADSRVPVDLSRLRSRGFAIIGADCCTDALRSAVRIDDVNGDGRDDLGVLSSMTANHLETTTTWLVFGKADSQPIELTPMMHTSAYAIQKSVGTRDTDVDRVARAGDVNGDGVADLLVAAPANNDHAGTVYAIFGARERRRIDVSMLRNAGFAIDGAHAWQELGRSYLGPAGDVDRDGFSDVLFTGRDGIVTEVWLAYGSPDSGRLTVGNIGKRGFRLGVPRWGDPVEVAAGGDVDGDGRVDVLVGNPLAAGEDGDIVVYTLKPFAEL
jgi:FG-GAP repeat/FG-GAP-like repeat